MKKLINSLFLFCLGICLFVPGLITGIKLSKGKVKKISQAEQRFLTTPADMAKSTGMKQKMKSFEIMMEDQLIIRDPVTIALNRMLVFGFGHSTKNYVVIGKDGYWFLLGNPSDPFIRFEFAGQNVITKKQFDHIGLLYLHLCQQLERQKITTITIIIPNKHSLFPDKLPSLYQQFLIPEKDRNITRLLRFVTDNHARIYFPDQLIKKLPPESVFNRRAFHWHEGGAQLVLSEIFKTDDFWQEYNISVIPPKEIISARSEPLFDLARMLGLGPMPYAYEKYRMPHKMRRVFNRDHQNLKKFMKKKNKYFEPIVFKSSNNNHLKALLVADSFGYPAFLYSSQHFQTTAFVTTNEFEIKPGIVFDMVRVFKPQVLIFLFNESWLSYSNQLIKLFSLKK